MELIDIHYATPSLLLRPKMVSYLSLLLKPSSNPGLELPSGSWGKQYLQHQSAAVAAAWSFRKILAGIEPHNREGDNVESYLQYQFFVYT